MDKIEMKLFGVINNDPPIIIVRQTKAHKSIQGELDVVNVNNDPTITNR